MANDKNNFENAMKKLRPQMEKLGAKYASNVIEIIQAKPRELNAAINDENIVAYNALLQAIVDELNRIQNIDIPVPVNTYSGKGAGENGDSVFLIFKDKKTDKFFYKIIIFQDNIKRHLPRVFKTYSTESELEQRKMLFAEIIARLIHEYCHFIDYAAPQHSVFGTKSNIFNPEEYDVSTYKKYRDNPSEVNTYKIQYMVRNAIMQYLQDFTPTPLDPLVQAYLNRPHRNI